MGKEKPNDLMPTRISNRNLNKKDQEQSVGRYGFSKATSGNFPVNKNRIQRLSQARNSTSPSARNLPPQKPANPSALSPKTTKTFKVKESKNSVSPSGSQVPLERIELSKEDNSMSQNNDEHLNNDGPKEPPPGNAEMWASVMAKLESMQAQQSEALQEIKEEIKTTNAGLKNDITLLRSDLDEVKNKISGYDSKWEELEKIKKDLVDMKKELSAQTTQAVQEVKQDVMAEVKTKMDETNQAVQEVKLNVMEEVKTQIDVKNSHLEEKLKDERDDSREDLVEKRDFLKEKCFNRRFNLILLGLAELAEDGDEKKNVLTILQNRLSIAAPQIDSVYRLGTKTEGKRPRPLMIMFSNWSSRCNVWFAKGKINENQENKLRLQEDLPPELRWELSILLKILRHAKSMPEAYPNARIKDYRIILNGTSYGVNDQDILPQDLQLAAIATPQSADAVAFFGRDSPFSNHFPCEFDFGGLSFNCMEQYLACQKAKLANNRALATKIMRAEDPADHKKALNQMKDAVPEKWKAKMEETLLKGLRAKFSQDEFLHKLLLSTYPRKLGEASRDPIWGTGIPLRDEKVLDVNEWNPEGNLLGKSLEAVREEFIPEQNQAQGGAPQDRQPTSN